VRRFWCSGDSTSKRVLESFYETFTTDANITATSTFHTLALTKSSCPYLMPACSFTTCKKAT